MGEKTTEKVLAREEELSTNVPKRRGRPPGFKNDNALKTM